MNLITKFKNYLKRRKQIRLVKKLLNFVTQNTDLEIKRMYLPGLYSCLSIMQDLSIISLKNMWFLTEVIREEYLASEDSQCFVHCDPYFYNQYWYEPRKDLLNRIIKRLKEGHIYYL